MTMPRCAFVYSTIPSGFFERLIVKLRRHFAHMDFNASSAAFYDMGRKLQIFLSRSSKALKKEDDEDVEDNMELLALFSSTTMWDPYRTALEQIERAFPGIQRVSFRSFPPPSLNSMHYIDAVRSCVALEMLTYVGAFCHQVCHHGQEAKPVGKDTRKLSWRIQGLQ